MKILLIAATVTSVTLLVPVVSPPSPPTPKVRKDTWVDKLALLLPVLSLPTAHANDNSSPTPSQRVVPLKPYSLSSSHLTLQNDKLAFVTPHGNAISK